MPQLLLDDRDRALLDGEGSRAEQLAMRVVAGLARVMQAGALLDVTSAHIDSCLYHGGATLDFAERLVADGARVAVPATLNVSAIDVLHPELFRGDPEVARRARRQMECYEEMGCRPTWTCAPYHLPERPQFGEQVAWGESNAIAFVNSVIGARSHRYGDFIDICAAITGRVPAAGLHLDENRRGQVLLRLAGIPDALLDSDVLYPVLGHLVGHAVGQRIAVIDGLPPGSATEDRLKALGAGAASSGSVALFHVVGVTPEAPTRDAAFGGTAPEEEIVVDRAALAAARDQLTTTASSELHAVALGTPHASAAQLAAIAAALDGDRVHADIECYVNTGRSMLAEAGPAVAEQLSAGGVQVVVDTCTYITPIIRRSGGTVMTDSAKWAYYAPGNLGVDVAFGSLAECVRSAVAGEITSDPGLWAGD